MPRRKTGIRNAASLLVNLSPVVSVPAPWPPAHAVYAATNSIPAVSVANRLMRFLDTNTDQRQDTFSPEDQVFPQGAPAGTSSSVGSDITAWQTALQSLPEEFSDVPLSVHPLAQLLANQPTLRQIEWNQQRQSGSFIPRTPHDFASLMIYVSGQVNPNPCRRCILKHGPFARCVVSPPTVLAQSQLRHACANCTYQMQYKKCTNDPVTEEELARSRAARSTWKPSDKPGFKPAVAASGPGSISTMRTWQRSGADGVRKNGGQKKANYGYVVQKPSAQSITANSFSDKLEQIRGWSPRLRRRLKAEVMQWQAALATVEAENTRVVIQPPKATSRVEVPAESPTHSTPRSRLPFPTATSAPTFGPPEQLIPGTMNSGQAAEDDEELEDSEDVSDPEQNHYEGPSWVGFDDEDPPVKPPI